MEALKQLIPLLPILAQITLPGNATAELIMQLEQIGEAELKRRQEATGRSRAELLGEAQFQWGVDQGRALQLLAMGHKESPSNVSG